MWKIYVILPDILSNLPNLTNSRLDRDPTNPTLSFKNNEQHFTRSIGQKQVLIKSITPNIVGLSDRLTLNLNMTNLWIPLEIIFT